MPTMQVCDVMKLPRDVARHCDMTFTDPPWETGALKMFETLMAKGGYRRPGNEIDAVLTQLFTLAPRAPLFIEYSVKGHERVVSLGQKQGHVFKRVIAAQQLNGKPYVIVQFNSDMPEPVKRFGFDILEAAIRYHKPKRIFEPFAGHCVHASRMVALGVDVVASEVNPVRAAKGFKALGLPMP